MALWSRGVHANGQALPFQVVLQSIHVPTFVLDSTGKVVFWNASCALLTGLPAEEVLGTNEHWRGFYPSPRSCLADLLLQGALDKVGGLYEVHDGALAHQDAMQAQNWCDLPRSQRRYLQIDAVALRDTAGCVRFVVETLQDQTAVKESEALRAAEHQETAKRRQGMMAAIVGAFAKLAQGDLTVRLSEPFPPEIDQVRQDFNSTVAQLAKTMSMIGGNGSNVRDCSHELAQIMANMLCGTAQMEQSMSATIGGLQQLNHLAKEAAEGTVEASRVVANARKEAEQSSSVVRQAVSAMGEIEASSREIGNIITVIDEIAFQTNLLALNAGVEAVRAGDAGRGFTVIATEVRALAQRSADAAKEIKVLVTTSGGQVVSGVKLVGEAGAALTRIVSHVETLNATITTIAEAAEQHSTGLEDVSGAMAQMHKVQVRTADLIDQTDQISQTLEDEAKTLETQLLAFRLVESKAMSTYSYSKAK